MLSATASTAIISHYDGQSPSEGNVLDDEALALFAHTTGDGALPSQYTS